MKIFFAMSAFLVTLAFGETNSSLFIDDDDGYFDVSKFLASKQGFLPTPILITGPTFGLGGGLNVMFLHGTLAGKKRADGKYVPPNITGAAAAATENGTRFAAAYHIGFFKAGDIRTTTFAGRPDANMDFGTQFGSVSLNTKGYALYQEVKTRLGGSDFFVGMNYLYMQIKSSFNEAQPPFDAILDKLSSNSAYGALSLVAEYDSRDSIFTPNRGLYVKGVYGVYNQTFGSDKNFENLRTKLFYYMPLATAFNLAFRAEYQTILGENRAPAFMTPSLILRGLANQNYNGQHALVVETEGRYEVLHRNWLVGFVGSGKTFGDYSSSGAVSFANAPAPISYGAGYRYALAKRFKLLGGFDVARYGNEYAFYITMGSAWNAFF